MRLLSGFAITMLAVILVPPLAAQQPIPVSPGSSTGGTVDTTCPTFSWSQVHAAREYELVVYSAGSDDTSPDQPLVSVRLPGGAQSWTPSLDQCLAPGQQYAWSLRAVKPDVVSPWSEPALFRVAVRLKIEEVQEAMSTLRGFLRSQKKPGAGTTPPEPGLQEDLGEPGQHWSLSAASQTQESPQPFLYRRTHDVEAAADQAELAPAAAPTLASPSLSVTAEIALGAASNVFKDGVVFLWDDTSGNTALGRNALATATGDSTGNTAVGREALRDTTAGGTYPGEGVGNTGVGFRALMANTTGFDNTAVGYRALANTKPVTYHGQGSLNTATGHSALHSNTSGSFNTATGHAALGNNTTGRVNTAMGARALLSNNTGIGNTASGYSALFYNGSGSYNTANGHRTLRKNTSGSYNTASGHLALHENTSTSRNTALGNRALHSNTGFQNTAAGDQALLSNTTGDNNTAIGHIALPFNTVGSRNTAIGHKAGYNSTTGSDNIFVGSGAVGVADEANTIRIGGAQDRTFIAGIHSAALAGSNEQSVCVDDAGQLGPCSVSSLRFKQDVEDLDVLGSRLLELRPVSFRFRDGVRGGPSQARIGLIAEEVAEVFPELVMQGDEGEPFGVKYELLSVLLLGELQAQHAELHALRQRLDELEEQEVPHPSYKTWWRRAFGVGKE